MFATSLKNEENLRRKTPFQVLVVAGLWVGSKGPTSLAAFHLKEISDVARFSLPFLVLAEQIGRDFLGAWDFKGRDWLIDRVRRRKVGKVHAKIRCQLFTLPYPESINKEGGGCGTREMAAWLLVLPSAGWFYGTEWCWNVSDVMPLETLPRSGSRAKVALDDCGVKLSIRILTLGAD